MHEYKDLFEVLESYDKTREWPVGRAHLDITLDKKQLKSSMKLGKKQTGQFQELSKKLLKIFKRNLFIKTQIIKRALIVRLTS